MPTLQRFIDIKAPRVALFELMQDYQRRLEWDAFLSHASLVDADKAALGTHAWCVEKSGLGMETRYVSFDPPHKVAVLMTKGPAVLERFAGSWIYKERADGYTRVIFKYHLRARPAFMRPFLDPIVTWWFGREMTKRLTALKAVMESPAFFG